MRSDVFTLYSKNELFCKKDEVKFYSKKSNIPWEDTVRSDVFTVFSKNQLFRKRFCEK